MTIADLFARLALVPDKKSFDAGDRMIGAIKNGLAAIVAYKTVQWASGLITQTAQAADGYNKLAAQVGTTSEVLQQLEHAATLSGSSLETLVPAMQRLSRVSEEAMRGGKEQQKTFRALGLDYRALQKGTLSLEDALGDIAERFAGMPDGAEKTALAMRVFGRSGAGLINTLNAGRDGLAEMRQEFIDLGAQVSTEAGREFEAFNDDVYRVRTALQGIRNQAVMALMPQIRKMAQAMAAWVKENRKLIRQRLEGFLDSLVRVVRAFAAVLGRVVAVIGFFSNNMDILGIAIASVIAALVTLRLTAIRAAIASAAAWVAALLPFILFAAAIAAVILIGEDLYTWARGGDSVFKRLYEAAKKWIGEKLTAVIEGAKKRVREFMEFGLLGRSAREGRTAQLFDEIRRRRSGDRNGQPSQAMAESIAPSVPMERSAAATSSTTTNNNVEATINVTLPTGADAEAAARAVKQAVADFWNGEMRNAAAATEI